MHPPLRPRPSFGVDANTSGYTSQLYVSLSWRTDVDTGGVLWPDHAVFVGFGLGPAYNTGHVYSSAADRLSLGSNLLIHSAIEIGYRLTPDWSLSVYFEHSSNAGFALHNAGLDNLGARAGRQF